VRILYLAVIVVLLVAGSPPEFPAQVLYVPPVKATPVFTEAAVAAEAAPKVSTARLSAAITEIVREQIPHTYEDTSKWGGTTQVWDGLHMHMEGIHLKTKRRFKEVNHGAWSLYRVSLIDPETEFQVSVENERELGDGHVGFDIVFTARLDAFARRSRWVKGVQLISLSVSADARVSLRLSCELESYLDLSVLPPDVVFDPEITAARLELVDFNVRRISDVGGHLAHELGAAMEGVIRRKLADKSDHLAAKINTKIDERRDDLRISLSELVNSQWARLQKYVRSAQP
jgi:hypothetical protein